MIPADIDRIWNEDHKQQRDHERRVAIILTLAFAAGIALLAWWVG